jgi:ATP-dependent protease Clp ATPase subunit
MTSKQNNVALNCTFCRKSEKEVVALLAFPDLYICDECVWLMVEIIATSNFDWRDRIIEKLKNVKSQSAQT